MNIDYTLPDQMYKLGQVSKMATFGTYKLHFSVSLLF